MGTNYYIKNGQKCTECGGTGKKDLHIGKSSAGWKFTFSLYKKSFLSWVIFLINKQITNEYNKRISLKDFLTLINDKKNDDCDAENDTKSGRYCRFVEGDFS